MITAPEFLADVAVLYTGDGTDGAFGTGRLIAPGLVLTAKHVVDYSTGEKSTGNKWTVCLHSERQDGRWTPHNAVVHWKAIHADLALLQMSDGKKPAPTLKPEFASYNLLREITAVAVGYPRACLNEVGERQDYNVHGRLRDASPEQPYFAWSLQQSDTPNTPELWKGLSGAVVCHPDSTDKKLYLFGAVQEVPGNFPGSLLLVARLSHAFDDEDFVSKLSEALGEQPCCRPYPPQAKVPQGPNPLLIAQTEQPYVSRVRAAATESIFQITQKDSQQVKIQLLAHTRFCLQPLGPLTILATKLQDNLKLLSTALFCCPDHNYITILQNLAEVGSQLRSSLIDPLVPKGAEDQHPTRRWFLVDEDISIHVPWGLLYDLPPTFSSFHSLTEAELQNGFWCTKYDTCAMYSTYDSTDSEPFTMTQTALFTPSNTALLAIFNEKALEYLKLSPSSYFREYHKRATTLKESITASDKDLLFYVFCHAENGKLILSYTGNDNVDTLTPEQLSLWIRDSHIRRRKGLFFLNGCQTVISKNTGSWLRLMYQSGFLGFIGTEAVIPTQLAWRFGVDFLQHTIHDRETPLMAMRTLRKKYWPFSLLYGLYCLPNAKLGVDAHVPEMGTSKELREECAMLPFSLSNETRSVA